LDISEGKFSMKAVIRRAAASVRTAMMLVSILTLTLTLALAPARAADDEVIVVFAAASLKNALDEVNAAWMRETGTAGAAISYAGSSALARQIEQGAPADIFISADLDWMDYLAERDLISQDSRVELLGNRLVLVAATGSDVALSIAPGFDLAGAVGEERLAMADTQAVPAGRYGRAALETLGVWDTVAAKIAQSENVRAALLLVSRGEAPLGIVYGTDAAADEGVEIVDTFPQDSHPPIIYPAALTRGAQSDAAASYLAFLRSSAARSIFEQQGFSMLAGPVSN
jgi:molybdate transport system substrate-binding protein